MEPEKLQNDVQNTCDFSAGACLKTHVFGSFELNAAPNIIKSENEIFFTLISKSKQPIEIKSAWLEGKYMFMGKIPLFYEESSGVYSANTLIGACTEDQMTWTMYVEFLINDSVETMMFDFISYQ